LITKFKRDESDGALTKKQKRDLQQDTKRRQVLKLEPLGNGSDPIQ